MNRQELHDLQHVLTRPALTITLPTHRHAPENKQDPIRVKKLVDEATTRLRAEYGKQESEPLIENLGRLVADINHRYTLDGLALFVTDDIASAQQLPFTVEERVHVGDRFLTRDLVFALNRTPHYWVLALSEKPTRLYEASGDELTEVTTGGFPMVHEGPGGELPLPGGFGVRKSAYRDEHHRKFFRQVDAALKPFLAAEKLPLVVVGVERFLAFFKEVTAHEGAIIATLQGSHDKTSAHELGGLVLPLVDEALREQREARLGQLQKAIGEGRSASAIEDVWRATREGRGLTLFVEEGYHYPACLDDASAALAPADTDGVCDETLDDAVDVVIDEVLGKGGEVVFVDDGRLAQHQRIALITRY